MIKGDSVTWNRLLVSSRLKKSNIQLTESTALTRLVLSLLKNLHFRIPLL